MDTPLERPLEAALRNVGYILGPRVYADQIIAQASRDDRESGGVTSEDVHLMQMPGSVSTQDPMQMTDIDLDEKMGGLSMQWHAITLGAALTEYQQMVADERVPAFLRTVVQKPRGITYKAHPGTYWKPGEALPARDQEIKSESLEVKYGDEQVLFIVGGRETNGLIEATFDKGNREVFRAACQQTDASYQLWLDALGGLNGKPFEPQPIADLVAQLVGGRT